MCAADNLSLNVSKPNELVMDFVSERQRSYTHHRESDMAYTHGHLGREGEESPLPPQAV